MGAAVLYVDDNAADLFLVKLAMQRLGIALDGASSIADAKRVFDPVRHIAAIIDWNLPDGEATEIARALKGRRSDLLVFFVSGVLTDAIRATAGTVEPAGCMEKASDLGYIKEIARTVSAMAELTKEAPNEEPLL